MLYRNHSNNNLIIQKIMSQTLCFLNYREFVTANCESCPKREKQGCRDVDPMDCSIAADLCRIQNEKGYQVIVGQFTVTPLPKKGGES